MTKIESEKKFLINTNLSWLEIGIILSPIIGAIGYFLPYGEFAIVGTIPGTYYGFTPLIINLISFLLALSVIFFKRSRQIFSKNYIDLLFIVIVPLIISDVIALYPALSIWYGIFFKFPHEMDECYKAGNGN